ncbi:MAG: Asp-tRNA(Asn)/Glu-tRNA(Gln) amidotransferase subunit GatC [Corynebacterium humireducens]|uniref:Aspartyl/glutamyl-tRNA(Asn/Gln) amidotransferase subunit C n=2 Tax=Corynebacterium humireducens TaxID=1223514 RepID=A0A0B5D754_9CORY|nr:Asp-tRNA(Asn)/Glu-tRNA(Gln) amidotransferase subunit GatC [Corynebacterium humireducens]AJE32972.1 asparaginyl/glutamyl-tRNA amidotransferase subunit C [Corynebacterium humireducens NBRC 106098 = DSM 45392]NLA56196.1 Asp-tRNA(Asn)/Glu-tRNA(Gln) amidotransferase subunit GatC [Corynebacterium humireducens]
MSEISRDEVAHLAMLSRLALSEEEIKLFAEQIDEIVGAVAAVQQVDTEGVEPMSHPHSIATAMRDDVLVPTLTAEQALDQAPATEDGRFMVPQILGEE